ncbi:HNH endonuclease [Chamaesiphon sp.]|uniref:HNH endonuclease n=1 Tax=Chamaesiphon sp. TaxID=2814140 RepID=UPI003592EBC7
MKRQNSICLLCEEPFTDEDEKHAHHIEGESEDPSLATDQDNIILIKGWIHTDYHDWLNQKGLPINRESLKCYAKMKNFSLAAL